jgi:predicted nucleic acid-binding protein
MPEAWDTTTAARLRPNSQVFEYAILRWRAGDPIAFAASTFNEISYGLHKAAVAGRVAATAQLRWLREQIAAGLLDILAFDERSADIAGALRAHMPTPPPAAKRGQRRSKADNRVAWIVDLQTAATVFAHGYDLVSADAHHPLIAAQLHALAPDAPALLIHTPPQL